ncbi:MULTISPECIES: MerR family transcriptional regulator [Brevibacillus]|jgi:DNA-binding transcriptional MerR regulator|uniref:HTH merR-type domain-containing protein n=1 Tax=Brevibacillus parabrevis TaxID=54914 RepID=A0A4Y3PV98_BREPA|nr:MULTISPECIES: MerR family transcriptional regulator [Brevibacillus]TGV28099.1 MerR family transcriptional regulator [Mesorhizobium sp. M00.F.Ca.ET.186.01.1.1]MBU8715550.1 helix-turn-helix domain-containing protein [Brevibacillus parabrevis]MDH6352183.1 DNA-binding transcriptional MerR regulator [Brevibacillus sp. 1238]MDR4998949.1 MerR family transcriptional regulator [Brevibacillus parabrevis]MED1722326.1 MerR family transcriptional regulator [Brevibacillus parabrevis]
MDVQVWMASKEVADRLDVHVRTLRNWLDLFVPVKERLKNPQGHYLISEAGFALLREVKERKDSGNSSLKEIQRQLIDEGRLSEEMLAVEECASAEETAVAFSAGTQVESGMREMELAVHETLVKFQQELTQLSSLNSMQSTILQKIADIEEMQESLRLEMRRVTFEMDLMQQRLTRRKERYARHEPRWSLNPFRWFTRSDRAAEQ